MASFSSIFNLSRLRVKDEGCGVEGASRVRRGVRGFKRVGTARMQGALRTCETGSAFCNPEITIAISESVSESVRE